MSEPHDDVDETILDAALERVLQVGIRRSSLEDIARRAGVSRVTIHRRFGGKDNLVEAMLERETRRILAEVTAIATTASGIDAQIEETILYVLLQTRMHRMVTELLRVAPEEVLGFYTVQGERQVRMGIDYIVEMLAHARRLGLIDDYDIRPVAELVARLAHSLMLTPDGGGVEFTDPDAARQFVRSTVVPLMKHGIATAAKEHVDDRHHTTDSHPAS